MMVMTKTSKFSEKLCNPCLKNDDSYGLNFEMVQYYLCQYKLPIAISLKCSRYGMNCQNKKIGLLGCFFHSFCINICSRKHKS
jgi:hypothetical protein